MPTCRVCRNEKECLISLKCGDGAEHEANMLSHFIDPNIEYQSSYICLSCIRRLEVTYNFKKQCKISFPVTSPKNQNQSSPNDASDDECFLVELEDPLLLPMHEETIANSINGKGKKYKCHICERDFNTKLDLRAHIERHRQKKDQQCCLLCNLKFLTKSFYKKHLAFAH